MTLFQLILAAFESFLTGLPYGYIGNRLRYHFFKRRLGEMGSGVVIGQRVALINPREISIGSNVALYNRVQLQNTVRIGANTHLGVGTLVVGDGHVTIGKGCAISGGVNIYSRTNTFEKGKTILQCEPRNAEVKIGDDVFIGAGAIILPGVSIGDSAVVGAGAVVTRDVPPFTIVAGVPARRIGSRE